MAPPGGQEGEGNAHREEDGDQQGKQGDDQRGHGCTGGLKPACSVRAQGCGTVWCASRLFTLGEGVISASAGKSRASPAPPAGSRPRDREAI